MSKISVITGFDGSCPQSEKAVERQSENTFTVYPSRRFTDKEAGEEPEGSGFRFGIGIANGLNKPGRVILHIDWEDEERLYMKYRDFVFIKGEEDIEWQLVPASVKGSISTVGSDVPPGKTLVYLNPKYNYTDNEKFVAKAAKSKLVKKQKVGKSEEGRNIWLLKIGEGNEKVLIMARNHAYESAGNYCTEGMIDWLLSGESLTRYFLGKFIFCFLPMTNPDGVYNGLCRLTSPQGADLNRIVTVPDKAHKTVKKVLDEIKPSLFINIHNWMDKSNDGLLCRNGEFARKISFYMPHQIEYGKRWYIEDEEELFRKRGARVCPRTEESWKNYCEGKFGSIGLVYEFPWWGRNARIMRETGIEALRAALLAWVSRKSARE